MATPTPSAARTVVELLAALQLSDAARPRITWYGPAGERIELSARTLANWVNKTANLLVDELDVAVESVVAIRMAPHWKSIVIDLAVRAAGGTPVWGDGSVPDQVPDLLVTDQPQPAESTPVLAVEPAALARAFAGTLPPEAIDYAAEVTGQDDVFAACEPAALPPEESGVVAGGRVLIRSTQTDAAERVLAVLRADGSVVLAVPEVPDSAIRGEGLS